MGITNRTLANETAKRGEEYSVNNTHWFLAASLLLSFILLAKITSTLHIHAGCDDVLLLGV